jgi:hypothetical protein
LPLIVADEATRWVREDIVSFALTQCIIEQVGQSYTGFFQLKLDHRFCLPLIFGV